MPTPPAYPPTSPEDAGQALRAARESFSGKALTETQLTKGFAITAIIRSEIEKTGSFREALTDFSHAYARGERFDALRGETILRDLYTARYGQTMNQTREGLIDAEQKTLTQTEKTLVLASTDSIRAHIEDGPTMPFYQAYDRAAVSLAGELKVTQAYAKSLMRDAYTQNTGRDLYADSKALEERHHRPVRDAEIAERRAEQSPARTRSQSMG